MKISKIWKFLNVLKKLYQLELKFIFADQHMTLRELDESLKSKIFESINQSAYPY
jgi:hypothetical protein